MAGATVAVDAGFAQRIAAAAGPGATVRRLEVLSGGHSGVTHVADVERGGRVESVVIKSTPPGRRPEGRHDVLRHLCTRLLLVEAHRADPLIADELVLAPVVVTGPARSGTSILHELLELDDKEL